MFAAGSHMARSDCAAADWRRRIIILPLDIGSSSSGRSKTLFGIGESGGMEEGDFTFRVAVSMGRACSGVVPIHRVGPSRDRSGLLAPGTAIGGKLGWAEAGSTSDRGLA